MAIEGINTNGQAQATQTTQVEDKNVVTPFNLFSDLVWALSNNEIKKFVKSTKKLLKRAPREFLAECYPFFGSNGEAWKYLAKLEPARKEYYLVTLWSAVNENKIYPIAAEYSQGLAEQAVKRGPASEAGKQPKFKTVDDEQSEKSEEPLFGEGGLGSIVSELFKNADDVEVETSSSDKGFFGNLWENDVVRYGTYAAGAAAVLYGGYSLLAGDSDIEIVDMGSSEFI